MNSWLAYALILTTVALVYYGLLQLSKTLYRRNPILLIAFMVFLAPFALVLTKAGSLLELTWMLLLTPFYGITVLMALFTNSMLQYYSVAYATLALIHHLFFGRTNDYSLPEHPGFKAFWNEKEGTRVRNVPIKTRLRKQSEQQWQRLTKSMKKYWDLALVFVLIAVVLITLVCNTTVEARDPTYQEALHFIATDRTDQNQYDEKTYTCVNFATDFKSNALKAGYRAGYVVVFFPNSKDHALDCFKTLDRGLIFVEPQYDGVITLIIGHPYWDRTRYTPPSYNDTVMGYTVTW